MKTTIDEVRGLRNRFESGDKSVIQAIKDEAVKYKFYHNIEIIPGVTTAGHAWTDEYVNRVFTVMKRFDFKGKRVLDIGCRDGALSFAAEHLGASEVIGIDNDLSDGLTNFLIPFKASKVQTLQCNVHHLSRQQVADIDIVIFSGVLYHLRYPIWALRRIADVLKPDGILIVESAFIEGLADLPLLFCPIGTDSPYEPTSVTFFNEAGITDTLLSVGFSAIQHHDTFNYAWNEQEGRRYLAANFPKFFKEYFEHKRPLKRKPLARIEAGLRKLGLSASLVQHRISICRKIFSCTKKWKVDDKRISAEDMEIMLHYWDDIHGMHTGQKVERNG